MRFRSDTGVNFFILAYISKNIALYRKFYRIQNIYRNFGTSIISQFLHVVFVKLYCRHYVFFLTVRSLSLYNCSSVLQFFCYSPFLSVYLYFCLFVPLIICQLLGFYGQVILVNTICALFRVKSRLENSPAVDRSNVNAGGTSKRPEKPTSQPNSKSIEKSKLSKLKRLNVSNSKPKIIEPHNLKDKPKDPISVRTEKEKSETSKEKPVKSNDEDKSSKTALQKERHIGQKKNSAAKARESISNKNKKESRPDKESKYDKAKKYDSERKSRKEAKSDKEKKSDHEKKSNREKKSDQEKNSDREKKAVAEGKLDESEKESKSSKSNEIKSAKISERERNIPNEVEESKSGKVKEPEKEKKTRKESNTEDILSAKKNKSQKDNFSSREKEITSDNKSEKSTRSDKSSLLTKVSKSLKGEKSGERKTITQRNSSTESKSESDMKRTKSSSIAKERKDKETTSVQAPKERSEESNTVDDTLKQRSRTKSSSSSKDRKEDSSIKDTEAQEAYSVISQPENDPQTNANDNNKICLKIRRLSGNASSGQDSAQQLAGDCVQQLAEEHVQPLAGIRVQQLVGDRVQQLTEERVQPGDTDSLDSLLRGDDEDDISDNASPMSPNEAESDKLTTEPVAAVVPMESLVLATKSRSSNEESSSEKRARSVKSKGSKAESRNLLQSEGNGDPTPGINSKTEEHEGRIILKIQTNQAAATAPKDPEASMQAEL